MISTNVRRLDPASSAVHIVIVVVTLLSLLTEQQTGGARALPAFPHHQRASLVSRTGLSIRRHPLLSKSADIYSSSSEGGTSPIMRPGKCSANTEYFIDCYFCGKISNVAIIYHSCCEGNVETVRFCTLLLL